MQERVVQPEILDSLPHDDPKAIHSRRDLRRINAMMGNTRWIVRQIPEGASVVEIGAGEGILAKKLYSRDTSAKFTGLDLAPRPAGLPDGYDWIQGDAFEVLDKLKPDVLVANLVLHHFEADALRELGRLAQCARLIVASEPARARRFHWLGHLANALGINSVTRHDLHVSIDAGFVGSELPDLLGLSRENWQISTKVTAMGAYQIRAARLE